MNKIIVIRLITLCRSCNAKVNKDIDKWFAYFSYVLKEYFKYKKWFKYHKFILKENI